MLQLVSTATVGGWVGSASRSSCQSGRQSVCQSSSPELRSGGPLAGPDGAPPVVVPIQPLSAAGGQLAGRLFEFRPGRGHQVDLLRKTFSGVGERPHIADLRLIDESAAAGVSPPAEFPRGSRQPGRAEIQPEIPDDRAALVDGAQWFDHMVDHIVLEGIPPEFDPASPRRAQVRFVEFAAGARNARNLFPVQLMEFPERRGGIIDLNAEPGAVEVRPVQRAG